MRTCQNCRQASQQVRVSLQTWSVIVEYNVLQCDSASISVTISI